MLDLGSEATALDCAQAIAQRCARIAALEAGLKQISKMNASYRLRREIANIVDPLLATSDSHPAPIEEDGA